MKKYLLLSLCLVMFLGIASFAEDVVKDSAGTGAKNADKIMSVKQKLGITDEQAAKIKAINADLKQKSMDLIKQVNSLSKELGDIMNADDPDLSQAKLKVKDMEKIRTQIMMNRLAAMKAVDKVLTKVQRDMMKQMGTVNKAPMPTPKGK